MNKRLRNLFGSAAPGRMQYNGAMGRGLIASMRLIVYLVGWSALVVALAVLADRAGRLGVQREGVRWLALTPAVSRAWAAEPARIGRIVRLDAAGVRELEGAAPDAPGVWRPAGELRPVSALLPPPDGALLVPATLRPFPTSPPLPTLSPTPTLTPSATLSPSPPPTLPPPSATPVPTLTPFPTDDLVATVVAFAALVTPEVLPDVCAPSGWPVTGNLVQRFHSRHSGIDLTVPLGTPVLATHSGVVTWADWNEYGYGNLVIVQSGPYITYYAHLTAPNVTVGSAVLRGAIIGWSGSTGRSSGPHVHYETRIDDVPVDPETFPNDGAIMC